VLAGYPLADMQCRLYDGSYHDVDSSAQAFEVAASLCFQDGAKRAGLHLLEPMMKNEIVVPDQFIGAVIGDINSRRGKILGQSQRGNAQVLDTEVPLASMFGYVTDLRSMTQGRATSSMHFSHYAPVPNNVQEQVVAKVTGRSSYTAT
jgi:elongation factor G